MNEVVLTTAEQRILLADIGAGTLADGQGDYASARALYEESLAIRRELGDRRGIASSLSNLGEVAYEQGDYASARALQEASLRIKWELGDRLGIANSLEAFAAVAAREGGAERSARLWGAAQALREAIGSLLPPNEREKYQQQVAAAQKYAKAFANGGYFVATAGQEPGESFFRKAYDSILSMVNPNRW